MQSRNSSFTKSVHAITSLSGRIENGDEDEGEATRN